MAARAGRALGADQALPQDGQGFHCNVCHGWPFKCQPATAHWGFADPAAVQGSDEDKRRAFDVAFERIRERVLRFVHLPLGALDAAALQRAIRDMGQSGAAQ